MLTETDRQMLALERPRFGQIIRDVAAVSSRDLCDCLALQRQQGGFLGHLLVQQGVIDDEQRLSAVRRQAEIVARMSSAEVNGAPWPFPGKLSLCMPAFNEEQNIGTTLESALAILPLFVADFEIVVVNDGSADRTAEVVSAVALQHPNVRLVEHPKNRGYGAAVTSGLRAATGDILLLMDSDGQFNLLDLPAFLFEIQQHDVVVGYRFKRAEGGMRRLNAWAWTRLVNTLARIQLRDLDCAFKLFRRHVIDSLELTSPGATISAEIMTQCYRHGREIRQLPVMHQRCYFGEQTGANLKVIWRAFRDLPRIRRYHERRIDAAHRVPEPNATLTTRHELEHSEFAASTARQS